MFAQPHTFVEILEGHTPQVARLARSLRRLVRTAAPTCREQVLRGYARYWNKHTIVAAITVHTDHVNLEFYYGAELTDPNGLLVGTGKRLRHIALRTPADLHSEYLTRLVRQAARHTPLAHSD